MSDLNLEQFDPSVAQLQEIVAESSRVVLTDVKDKEQLDLIKKTRIKIRDTRVRIKKRGKELREDALKFQKDVLARERELIEIIEPEENRLKGIEEEIAAKKLRTERIALLPERKKRLNTIGDGRDYSDKDEVLIGMDDTEFEAYYNERVAKKNEADRLAVQEREQAAREEERRLAEEERARQREEKARQEERERIEREAKQEEERKERDRKALEEQERYQSFLKDNGYTEETKGQFYIERLGTKVVLYKKVAELQK